MKILAISSTIYPVPPVGYGGLEQVVYDVVCGLAAAGHSVTVAAPEGSLLPDGVAHIPTQLKGSEEEAYKSYKEALETGGWDAVWDNTWEGWSYLSSVGRDPQLPIVHTFHAYPEVWGRPPAVRYPCFVGISEAHSRHIRNALGVAVETVYNGVDPDLWPLGDPAKRTDRLLWVGRYTPEKGPLEAIRLAKRLRMNLTLIGDTESPKDRAYVARCFEEADGLQIRALPAMARQALVPYYQTHRALVYPLQWEEPFGLVLVEAMLAGLPVVALDAGSVRELVDPQAGVVCRNLLEMEQVLYSPDALRSMSTEKIREVGARFSTSRMVEGYTALFQTVAERAMLW